MLTALSLRINGIVQGVGFRPWVYRLAAEHELKGWIHNASNGVTIEIEGPTARLQQFVEDLRQSPPPLARIETFETAAIEPQGFKDFSIRESQHSGGWTLASPDVATCQDCLEDIQDPENPRFGYAFANCTNCGPRYTIINGLPYDRPQTTMREFPMCPRCDGEYHDPGDRRFHAQPTCCPECGPQLFSDLKGDPLAEARESLKRGEILALKGLGGYQLIVDATNPAAIQRLRDRKHRPDKPLALMVATLQHARQFVSVDGRESQLLTSAEAPIVLLNRLSLATLPGIAEGLDRLGLMLPNTPLHHLLLSPEQDFPQALVVTSGNLSGEPISISDEEAKSRLGNIADHFLWHHREIITPVDDSVVRSDFESPTIIRRARGYAPSPIDLPVPSDGILALGGDLKCAIALTKGGRAILSQHIGDLEDALSRATFQDVQRHLIDLFSITPTRLVCDRHPDYHSHQLAQELGKKWGVPVITVQHHRAHVAACLADNGIKPQVPVIGVALDGAGYGDDGTIWGGEFFTGAVTALERQVHFPALPLPGGDAATKHPYRLAIATLHTLGLPLEQSIPYRIAGAETQLITRMVDRGINTPYSCGVGRLFDLMGSLLGICHHSSFEGQAAQMLEAIAEPCETFYPYSISENAINLRDALGEILTDLNQRVAPSAIAGRFHRTVAQIVLDVCRTLEDSSKLVALSGGVFQNRLLLRQVVPLLERSGFIPLVHHQVPANDGGLALGQAYLASLFP